MKVKAASFLPNIPLKTPTKCGLDDCICASFDALLDGSHLRCASTQYSNSGLIAHIYFLRTPLPSPVVEFLNASYLEVSLPFLQVIFHFNSCSKRLPLGQLLTRAKKLMINVAQSMTRSCRMPHTEGTALRQDRENTHGVS